MQLFQLMVSVAFAVMWSLSHFCSFWWTWFFYFFFSLLLLGVFSAFSCVMCLKFITVLPKLYDALLVALPWRGYSEYLLLTTLFTFVFVCVFVIWITYSGWVIPKIPKITRGFLLSKGNSVWTEISDFTADLGSLLFSLLLTLILLILWSCWS